jgi:hypothetical protein
LKEAPDLVDACPATLLEKASKETADKAKAALEAAGATVTIKESQQLMRKTPFGHGARRGFSSTNFRRGQTSPWLRSISIGLDRAGVRSLLFSFAQISMVRAYSG